MGILPLKKRVNHDKCSFTTKRRMFGVFAIDEILRYQGTRFPSSRTLCHPDHNQEALKLICLMNFFLFFFLVKVRHNHYHHHQNHQHHIRWLQCPIFCRFFWMSTGKPLTFENWNSGEPNNFQ